VQPLAGFDPLLETFGRRQLAKVDRTLHARQPSRVGAWRHAEQVPTDRLAVVEEHASLIQADVLDAPPEL
jgi:hypothetical protein